MKTHKEILPTFIRAKYNVYQQMLWQNSLSDQVQ